MKLFLANTGSYPRIGEAPERQELRRIYSAWERGEKTAEELRASEDAAVRAAVEEQVRAGLDVVTDGQIRWHDPISHLAGKLAGIEINGLLRFFDTNFYFRQPVAKAAVSRKDGLVKAEYEFARSVSSKPVKPVLTGPYTLAKFTLVEHEPYRTLEPLVHAYAECLGAEMEALAAAGADLIQLDEPAILKHPADFPILQRAVEFLARHKGRARLALYLYFGDPAPLYERLQKLPIDVLGLDFTYNPKLVTKIVMTGSTKALGLGLMDGRNTKLEEAAEVAQQIERILPRVRAEVCYLNPSCGLEYLPRDRALAKLERMAAIRAGVKGLAP
jgi:5-methyltetrahydropteroyltriglutamate--homocysteine methyltransferase